MPPDSPSKFAGCQSWPLPSSIVHRRVEDLRGGRVALVERRRVDDRLERRAGLPLRLGGAVELGFVEREAADHRQHPPGERIHRDARAADLRDLTQAVLADAPRHRFDVEDVAGLDQRLWGPARPAIAVGRDRAGLPVLNDGAGLVVLGLESDADRRAADVEGDRELPRLDVGVGRNVGQRHAPVLAEIDALERSVPAMGFVVAHQPVDQGLARHQLNLGIERGSNRKPALVELLFAVALAELAPHLLGEEAGGDRVGRQHARIDDERLGAGLARLIGGDVAVLGHAPDDVVAPLHRPVVVAERIEGARLLGQRREIGDLRDRKLVHRLVEIVQRRRCDAVVRQAEVDLVEVELEDLLLGIGGLDADAEQDFANLAVERAIRAQEEILRHLLGDGRGALDVARALQEHDARAHDALRGRNRHANRSSCPRRR